MAIDFGLSPDHNFKLMSFIDPDALSRLPLTDEQIDALASVLNWHILSSRRLSGYVFTKYKHLINWEAFLMNGSPKDLLSLLSLKDILLAHAHVFNSHVMKYRYYTSFFVSALPELIDWRWLARYKPVDEHILTTHWRKFDIRTVSKYQTLSEDFIRKKALYLHWQFICRKPLTEAFLNEQHEHLDWSAVARYQKLSEAFILRHIFHFKDHQQRTADLCQYQELSEDFITKHKHWLNLNAIALYQNLSYEFLQRFTVDLSLVSKNRHFNKPGAVQVIRHADRWFVINAPLVCTNDLVTFCSPDLSLA